MKLFPYKDELAAEWVAWWKSYIDSVLRILLLLFKDRKVPLEERWEMYIQVQPFLPRGNWVMLFTSLPREMSWYDDFSLHRYAVMDLDEDFVKKASRKYSLTEKQINALKEEILKYGYGSFQNDW